MPIWGPDRTPIDSLARRDQTQLPSNCDYAELFICKKMIQAAEGVVSDGPSFSGLLGLFHCTFRSQTRRNRARASVMLSRQLDPQPPLCLKTSRKRRGLSSPIP